MDRLIWMDWIANRLSHVVVVNSDALATILRLATTMTSTHTSDPNGLDLSRFDDLGDRRGEIRCRLVLDPEDIGIVDSRNLIPYKGYRDLDRGIRSCK